VVSVSPNLTTKQRRQKTLKGKVSFSGIGIHTGAVVKMAFCPAPEGTGIQFKRTDLPNKPVIPATLEYVCDTARSTTIGLADVRVHTVEHVLAALCAFNIDNLIVELSNFEPPVADGSSQFFVEMIERAGIEEQEATVPIVQLQHPIYLSKDDIHLVALPCEEYRISYTLDYPNSSVLSAQYYSTAINRENFKREIAPCRTFSRYEEVSYLMDRGLIKGGSLDNAVIIKDDVVISKEGLHFPNEMARHKLLDMIGDLFLIGFDIMAHIIAIRSGHASNFAFAKKLFDSITTEKC